MVGLKCAEEQAAGEYDEPDGGHAASGFPFFVSFSKFRGCGGGGEVDEGLEVVAIDHGSGFDVIEPFLDIDSDVFSVLLEKAAGVEGAVEKSEVLGLEGDEDVSGYFAEVDGVIHRDFCGFAGGSQCVAEALFQVFHPFLGGR